MNRYRDAEEEISAREQADEHKLEERKIAQSEATIRAKALLAVKERITITFPLNQDGVIEYTLDGQPKTFYRKPIALCSTLEAFGFIADYRINKGLEVQEDDVWVSLDRFISEFTPYQSHLLVAQLETNKAWKEAADEIFKSHAL